MTIISKIKELREKYPEKAALIDVKTGSRVTFSQIDDKSDRICIYLKEKKFRKGDKIVVFVPIGIEFYLILMAIFKMGLQAVFIDPYAGLEHINRCCEMISPEGIIGSGKTLLKGFFLKGIRKIDKKINYMKMIKETEKITSINNLEFKEINENLKNQLDKSMEVLDISQWQKEKLRELNLITIRDVLGATESELKKAAYIGQIRARKIKNTVMAAVLEYLSG